MQVTDVENYYVSHYDKLVKQVSNRCGNFHDAEDIVQTAFERAIKYVHVNVDSVEKWFAGILRNVFRDYQQTIRLGPVTKPLEEHLEDIEPIVPNDIYNLVKFEVSEMMRAEKEPIKTVVKLHIDFGFTCGEISEMMQGLTYNKVRGIITNFRRKVMKRYE